ncbi:MAG: UDP-N-acetylglucosamine 2-epimerase (non-hydrolyzing) [Clostridiales bacterium]
MDKHKILSVFGTRPEAVKLAPLVNELKKNNDFKSYVCVTAQHRKMLDQVLEIFNIEPDYDLNIMKSRQTLVEITSRATEGLYDIYNKLKPDMILVHGDTTTTFAASLAAYYCQIKVGHVEAGLRTFDKYFPFPEEINRKLTGVLSDLHFAPTLRNKKNLLREGINEDSIFITGNTVIDALKTTIVKDYTFTNPILNTIDFKSKKVITVTAHRRENLGQPLVNICEVINKIANNNPDVEIIYPVHLNPAVRDTVYSILSENKSIHLIEPIDVQEMHNLMSKSYLILTDSGGIQEEAPSLGKPVIVLRNETERPEAVDFGTVKLAGTNKDKIFELTNSLLNNKNIYKKMANSTNPYGDGNASKRIVKALKYYFKLENNKPIDLI